MHNNDKEMPYFIKPSLNLDKAAKQLAYQKAKKSINALLNKEKDVILKMATINAVLKNELPYAYWVGFYCVKSKELLSVGPYQGTTGCLYIPFGKGVCGTVAVSEKTKIVDNVHALEEGKDHITCDQNSQSEIVVPVFDKDQILIAVFDMDSTKKSSFDELDQKNLEQIMKDCFQT